jgi:O-antigen/teichoic acid export membrane protein
MTAMFPQLARYFSVARARLRRTERGLSASLLGAGVLSGLVLAAVANLVARRIFGPEYARTVPVLHILALALPLVFVNSALTHFLVARDLGVLNLVFSGLMVPINFGANLLLSRRWGAPGAGWSTLITEASLLLCCVVALRAARRDDASFPATSDRGR